MKAPSYLSLARKGVQQGFRSLEEFFSSDKIDAM